MTELPDLDPSRIEAAKLHEKLLDARTASDLEAQKSQSAADLEAQKAGHAESQGSSDSDHAVTKAESDADLEAEASERTKELELRAKYHEEVMKIAGAAIDRSRDSAKFVQTAAAAILTAYAALLGLVFSNEGRPLPVRGVYAAVFLGLAVAFAVAYLAFVKETEPTKAYAPRASFAETQLARTGSFIDWVNSAVGNRRTALRASVVAFAFGIAFIPAAFVGATGGSATTATADPTPPSIPDRVPAAVAEDAARLFRYQVDAYFAAVDEGAAGSTPSANGTPAPVTACSGYGELFSSCAWTTETGVERAFRRFAALGLILVVLIPGAFTGYEWSKRRSAAK